MLRLPSNPPPSACLDLPCECHRDAASRRDGDVLRCTCGSLMARFVDGRVELKCRRCKRLVKVAVEGELSNVEVVSVDGSMPIAEGHGSR